MEQIEHNLIDFEYLKVNLKDIEQLKDKKMFNAISVLLKFQQGEYLLDDKQTNIINTVTPNTVFTFNQALIKDIANSYKALADSIDIVMKSEYKDLLLLTPKLFGKELSYFHGDDVVILADNEKKELINDYLLDKLENKEDLTSNLIVNRSDYYYLYELKDRNFSKNHNQYGFLGDKKNSIMSINKYVEKERYKRAEEAGEIIFENAISSNQKSITIYRNEKNHLK